MIPLYLNSLSNILISCQRIAHSLSDNSIPSELIRYEKVDLVVQSLREMPDYKPLLSNWAAMLRSLQGEDRRKSISKGDQRQSIVTQRVLVRFLLTSVQTEVMVAATEYHESILDPDMVNAWLAKQGGLQIVRTGGAKSRKNAISSTHEDLTMALLSALPGLLATFRSETQVMQCLTSLPQYFRT